MHPDIFTPGTCLFIVVLCLTTDASLTAKHIFEVNLNWAGFRLAEKDNLRDVEIKEVKKMLSCKDESRGFFTYECESCGTQKTVYFGCNSRICTNCSKNHTDKWASIHISMYSQLKDDSTHAADSYTKKSSLSKLCEEHGNIRYIRHPAVANTRLQRYDGKEVTFWYEDHKGKRHFVTMKVREFIKALIQHIPDRNFKMIRHYGAYSHRTKRKHSGYLQRSLRQATFEDFITKMNKWGAEINA
jgi:hypothetical protein